LEKWRREFGYERVEDVEASILENDGVELTMGEWVDMWWRMYCKRINWGQLIK
jgi:hypothetical protein